MDVIQAIILGIVQGLTEFLPVSSSAHLVFFQNILGTGPSVAFDTVLHLGTLVAVVSFFWRDILSMIKALVSSILDLFRGKFLEGVKEDVYKRLVWLLVVGTIPAGVMGIAFKSEFEALFTSILAVGFFLLITGVLLWMSEHYKQGNKEVKEVSFKNALAIGIFQGFAIAPGISRSGSTIAAGLFSGLNRELAARYSFLLSIPAILGAALVQVKDITTLDMTLTALIAGFIAAVVFGYLAIKLLLKIIKDWKLNVFAYYCWIVGIASIIVAVVLHV